MMPPVEIEFGMEVCPYGKECKDGDRKIVIIIETFQGVAGLQKVLRNYPEIFRIMHLAKVNELIIGFGIGEMERVDDIVFRKGNFISSGIYSDQNNVRTILVQQPDHYLDILEIVEKAIKIKNADLPKIHHYFF
jgi:hypothetical protein